MLLQRIAVSRYGIDSDGSRLFRRRRFQLFLNLVDGALASRPLCRILDVGGEPAYWANVEDMLGTRAYHVTLLNLAAYPVAEPTLTSVAGDARNLREFENDSFDIVHSNSVIEHVGRWTDMTAMASEIRRVAPTYFVQTPNFWFPIEPHCSTAFFHWMPESVRIRMLMARKRGNWSRAPDVHTAMRQIQSNTLIDARMLSTLFPDASIHRERILSLTKSLIAIRAHR